MREIYDPTANARVAESLVTTLQPTEGYTPMLSPTTGLWFAHQNWNNHSIRLEDVASDHIDAVNESILRHELFESICARAEQVRAEGKKVPNVAVNESRHDHVTRSAVFSACRSSGYSNAEIAYAYETIDQVEKLANADLGAQGLTIEDGATITEGDDAVDSGSDE